MGVPRPGVMQRPPFPSNLGNPASIPQVLLLCTCVAAYRDMARTMPSLAQYNQYLVYAYVCSMKSWFSKTSHR